MAFRLNIQCEIKTDRGIPYCGFVRTSLAKMLASENTGLYKSQD
jgi:hypothetical protein